MGLFSWLISAPEATSKPVTVKEAKRGRGRPRETPITSVERKAATADLRSGVRKPPNPKRATVLFYDLEWFIDQRIYCLGYAYNQRCAGWIYDDVLTWKHRSQIKELFDGVDTIYFYGPDAAMVQKQFAIDLKGKYRCINLLKAIHDLEPDRDTHHEKRGSTNSLWRNGRMRYPKNPWLYGYKLANLEKTIGIHRETDEYKADIWKLDRDWRDGHRDRALLYNKEDVINMIKVKEYFYKKHHVTRKQEEAWRLQ